MWYIVLTVIDYFFYDGKSVESTHNFELKNFLNPSKKFLEIENPRKYSAATSSKLMSTTTEERITMTKHKTASPKTPAAISQNTKCTMWKYPPQVELNGVPRINLDPNRFLYPSLVWGPSNQIEGLQQAVYLSIKLNR